MNKAKDQSQKSAWTYRTPSFHTFQLAGLLFGIIWVAPRLYAALISTSVGLLADAVQHVVEVAFSIFVFLALRAAKRSCALLFPHGTGKFETIGAAIFSISLVLSGGAILVAGVMRILNPEVPERAGLGILLLAISLCINVVLFVASRPLERNGTVMVKVWRKAYMMDIWMKSATILFVFVAQSGGLLVYADPLAAIIIGLSTLYFAVEALAHSVWELTDRALEEEVQMRIVTSLAHSFHAFDDLVDVRTRRVGNTPIIEVIVGFDLSRTWQHVVDSADELRAELEKHVAGAEVMVIPTPCGAPSHT